MTVLQKLKILNQEAERLENKIKLLLHTTGDLMPCTFPEEAVQ